LRVLRSLTTLTFLLWLTDVDAPAGKLWFVNENSFTLYRRNPWDWEATDGNIWKWITNYDAFEALMKQYWEFAIDRRNSNGVMSADHSWLNSSRPLVGG
jgi:hypothetical protein